jgi:hypothetical protein
MQRFPNRTLVVVLVAAELLVGGTASASPGGPWFEVQSLDGTGNNRSHPKWGVAGAPYLRLAPARYVDGVGQPVNGPNSRYISNRVFNGTGQRLSSGRGVTEWAAAWAQFLDHTFGRRADSREAANIPYDNADPLETAHNDLGAIQFARSRPADGTGVTSPREQMNLLNSYVDAFAVYGTPDRLEWMREGPVDGDMSNNGAHLLLQNGMLPRRDARGDAGTAPGVDDAAGNMGPAARVAGDIRANENPGLLAVQTLFAREHNRIVDRLPKSLPEEVKFQIARRVVIATEQYITYEQFLPSLGVQLSPYRGYDSNVNPTLGNEFATIGYRGHSMLHDDIRLKTDASQYTSVQLDAIRAMGVTVTVAGGSVEFTIPPNVSLFNPNLVDAVHLGSVLQGLSQYAQANNDEQIGDVVRTIPVHAACPPICQTAIFDISAIDVERGRDHGLGSYNQLRQAFGLAPKSSFADVTGEASETFPADPLLTPGDEINDPNSLDFLRLRDAHGRILPPDTSKAVTGERRTPLAARLKGTYGSVSTMDGFVGMVAEPKVPGTEFGELQLAMWRKQFEALRDGDRFFYRNDPVLAEIRRNYGMDYRRSLSDLIALNTDIPHGNLPANVFRCSCP